MSQTILLVDDKRSIVTMLSEYLSANGFRVVSASNGREALFVARDEKPDLVLLDIMMPEMDGLEFMRLYRKERDTPIILLTARAEETDKVIGLELGADAYLTKPFSPREVLAHIRAILRLFERAAQGSVTSDVIRAADIALDKQTRVVTVGDKSVDLTPSEFDLLSVLMAVPGIVFSRADLLERLKGDTLDNVERTIDVHIRNLRAKIEPDASDPRYILTVYGVGYRFTTETT